MTLKLILILVLIATTGLLSVLRRQYRFKTKINFASNYLKTFTTFTNHYFKKKEDNGKYGWLITNSIRIQKQLGELGKMTYKPPFKPVIISNYEIVLNTIPKFRNGDISEFETNTVEESILRYLGHNNDSLVSYRKQIINPLQWFRYGIHELISLPLNTLYWFGITKEKSIKTLTDSSIFKITTGISSLLVFFSSLVTIIVGWEKTKIVLYSIFQV